MIQEKRSQGVIVVQVPVSRAPEREYVLSVLLGEFLGIDYRIEPSIEKRVQLTLPDSNEARAINMADSFFGSAGDNWLQPTSLPTTPLKMWSARSDLPEAKLVHDSLPVIYGQPLAFESYREGESEHTWLRQNEEGIDLGLDIFGSAFFMLTRYEEVASPVLDDHARFPATASLALREGFLERPIVNEYLEVLWTCMQRLWPSLVRRHRTGEVRVSHDVDWPLSRSGNPARLLKSSAADVLRRRSPSTAVKRIRSYWGRRRGKFDHDPHNTFEYLMNMSERHGHVSAFYFITENTAGPIDGEYDLANPWIRSLMSEIHERGHEIGLHPSYCTYRDPPQIRAEFQNLLQTADDLSISQPTWGGRQHYLRWEAPTTWQGWNDAGLTYDSTVGYADHAGFRAGTCYEYSTFNLISRQQLALKERPLIVMEGTLLGKKYMNLDYTSALEYALGLRARCLQFEGTFTLLWHNSHFLTRKDFFTYEALLRPS